MLEGVLVDLVPYDAVFRDLEHGWRNNESAFWGLWRRPVPGDT
jgi:hypothetical protein